MEFRFACCARNSKEEAPAAVVLRKYREILFKTGHRPFAVGQTKSIDINTADRAGVQNSRNAFLGLN